jgi:hypothetical protein
MKYPLHEKGIQNLNHKSNSSYEYHNINKVRGLYTFYPIFEGQKR